MPLRPLALAAAVLAVLGIPAAFAARTKPAAEVLARVQYHVGEIDRLTQHFESIMTSPCPHFASSAEWDSYFDGEVDQVVTLVAHVEQAWREALQTGDDDVRRAAKAPGKRLKE